MQADEEYVVSLWQHEVTRVIKDRICRSLDIKWFEKTLKTIIKEVQLQKKVALMDSVVCYVQSRLAYSFCFASELSRASCQFSVSTVYYFSSGCRTLRSTPCDSGTCCTKGLLQKRFQSKTKSREMKYCKFNTAAALQRSHTRQIGIRPNMSLGLDSPTLLQIY